MGNFWSCGNDDNDTKFDIPFASEVNIPIIANVVNNSEILGVCLSNEYMQHRLSQRELVIQIVKKALIKWKLNPTSKIEVFFYKHLFKSHNIVSDPFNYYSRCNQYIRGNYENKWYSDHSLPPKEFFSDVEEFKKMMISWANKNGFDITFNVENKLLLDHCLKMTLHIKTIQWPEF